jgi:polar amino acid transport system ATP-binding protein
MVRIEGLHKHYGDLHALRGVDISVPAGGKAFIVGPSGCGKSTLLRCINLLEEPSAGLIEVGGEAMRFSPGRRLPRGRELARYRSRIGMVFQQFNLFPHMTALGNVMEGPVTVRRMPKPEARDLAMSLLAKVGLAEKAGVHPSQLSGGQAQRVAIARALAMQPRLMLFDEVTSALDPELVGEVLEVLKGLAADGTTMLVVTHEMGFALEVADTVLFMEAGSVVEQGPAAEVLLRPRSPRLQSFLARFHAGGRLSSPGS